MSTDSQVDINMLSVIRKELETNSLLKSNGEFSITLFDIWKAGYHYETVQRGPVCLGKFFPTEKTREEFVTLLRMACLEKDFKIIDSYDLTDNLVFYIK